MTCFTIPETLFNVSYLEKSNNMKKELVSSQFKYKNDVFTGMSGVDEIDNRRIEANNRIKAPQSISNAPNVYDK